MLSSSVVSRVSLLVSLLAVATSTACTRDPDPVLDIYIMPLYIAGMIPLGVNVGARDVTKASRGWRVFSFVCAIVYVGIGVVTIQQGWPRSGVFALLLAAVCAYLPFRRFSTSPTRPIV